MFWRKSREQDLEDEIAYDLAAEAEENVRACHPRTPCGPVRGNPAISNWRLRPGQLTRSETILRLFQKVAIPFRTNWFINKPSKEVATFRWTPRFDVRQRLPKERLGDERREFSSASG